MYQSERRLVISLGLMAAVSIAVYAAVGLYARYWADDYCVGALVRDRGWLGAQKAMFGQWTGKFSNTAALVTTLRVGPRAAPALPLLLIGTWLMALTWTMVGLAHSSGHRVALRDAVAMAVAGVFLAIDRMPDYVQSLYWQSGTMVYTAPLVVLTVLAGAGARWPRSRHRALMLAVLFGLAFVAGGFSETVIAVETAALGALLGWVMVSAEPSVRRQWLPPVVSCLLGAVLALGVMAAAPGNAARLAALPPRAPWDAIAAATTWYAARHLIWWLGRPPFTAMFAAAVSVVVGRMMSPRRPNRPLGTAAGIALGTLGLAWVSILPAVWGYGPAAGPDSRTYTVTSFVLTIGLCTAAALFGRHRPAERLVQWWTASPRHQVVLLSLLALSPATSLARPLTLLPQARTYAAAWDTRNQWIHLQVATGVRRLSVVPLPAIAGLNDLAGSPPQNWVNKCIADYYGLESIVPATQVDQR